MLCVRIRKKKITKTRQVCVVSFLIGGVFWLPVRASHSHENTRVILTRYRLTGDGRI